MTTSQTSGVIQHLRKAVLLRDGAGLTDGQLLEDYINRRDGAAFAALVRRHGPMVWGVCRRVLCNHHDAEDAFQATFLVLVRKAASVVPREMVANWLYGVAHQTALKAKSMVARRKRRERQGTGTPEPAVAEQDLWHDLQPLLDEALSRLPDKYREPVVLCDLEGKTYKEAARQLGCPEGTLAARLARARARLARRLTQRGVALSGGVLVAVLTEKVASAGVPSSVVSSTLKAVTLVAAGQTAATGAISVKVAALTEGVLRAMLLTRLKTRMALVGTLGSIAIALGLSAYHGSAQQPVIEPKEPIKQVAEEPATKDSDKPDDKRPESHYCWLAFGLNGKARALVRLEGEEVAVDRDGDGKFDGKGERFASEKDCKGVVIADPDARTSYAITSVHVLHVVPPEKFIEVRVHIRGPLEYHQGGLIQTAKDRETAPQAHFHGSLTIAPQGWRIVNRASRLAENDLVDLGSVLPQSLRQLAGKGIVGESTLPRSLRRTGEPTTLSAGVVTGGENSFVSVCSPADTDEGRREKSPFPKGVHPFVDVEFPAKRQGDPAIQQRYPLDQHCGDGCWRGPVRVPAEAGVGKAKVTFSFDAWNGAKVAPTTVEIPIDEPQEETKDQEK